MSSVIDSVWFVLYLTTDTSNFINAESNIPLTLYFLNAFIVNPFVNLCSPILEKYFDTLVVILYMYLLSRVYALLHQLFFILCYHYNFLYAALGGGKQADIGCGLEP
jgi:hypothetical protein